MTGRIETRLLLLASIACAPACGRADSTGTWRGTIETLPNQVVRVTNPREGLWTAQSHWQLQPELTLGSTEGAGADVFASISGLQVGADGHIYVLDRQADELRIFNGEGKHIRTVGRPGEGPGEYKAANGLLWLAPDTLVVVDQQGERYSMLTSAGDYVRAVPRRLGFYGWVMAGGMERNRVYEVSSLGDTESNLRSMLLGTALRSTGALATARGAAVEGGAAVPLERASDTIFLAKPAAPIYESYSIRTARGGMVLGVPFTGQPVWFLDGAGHLWHGHGSVPRIYRFSLGGDTLTEIRLDTEPFPVTAAEIASYAASPMIKRFKELGGNFDPDRIPKTRPYFNDIIVGDDGFIWLSVPAAGHNTVFNVLDADGRYLGRLQIEGTTREPYIHPVLRNDRLYFVGRDELDVQRVHVEKIVKPARS